jgi:hypothetical protein
MNAILGTLAVAGVAFTAGVYWSGGTTAAAGPEQEQALPPEVQAKMEAWAKAAAPGKHHKYLEEMVGEWHGTFQMWMEPGAEPMRSTGTVERQWVLGGRFLKETIHAQSDMGEFHGLGYIGFNNMDGLYEFVWMEDMSTSIMSGTGSFDPDERVFRWHSQHRDPSTGHLITSWSTLEATSPGHHTYTGWQIGPDGKKFKSFQGEVERK